MKFELAWLAYPLLLLTAIALGEGLNLFFADRDAGKHVNRRLRVIAAHPDRREAFELLRRKAPGEGSSAWLADFLKSSPLRALDRWLGEADIQTPVERVCLYIVVVMLALTIAVHLLFKFGLPLSGLIGVVVGFLLPMWLINRMRRRRLNHLADQLPDALDMLVRSLKAGHPVPTGISICAHEMSDPIGTEFGLVSDEMSYGSDFRVALERMGERLRIPEINYMVVALRIQYGTGGNLADILNSLSQVMRARRNLFAKVKALSAEARLGGKILGAMPPGIVALISVFNPHFYDDVGVNTTLTIIMGGAGFVCLLGMVMIRKIVNIRV
jgi:tight adherence protein B